jgi:hypothetical protein
MTREEAIRIFRKEIECLSHTKCEDCIFEKSCDLMTTPPYGSEYIDAYSMAIKALEQEPILDKIRAEIESKCDRINSLASILRYPTHREIQELLCDILKLLQAESEE